MLFTDPLIRRAVRKFFATDPSSLQVYEQPAGDTGLFGPQSVTWRIHSDFPGMMSGGLCALLLQTLHPLALAGVWDHSNFRHDLLGRLRRTTAFVAATSYAPRARALAEIERVRGIHSRVQGQLPDGRFYRADDPELLTWVHITEMWSFVRGYQVYRGVQLPRALLDHYYDETRRIAEQLGAVAVPRSTDEVEAYFRSIQPQLAYTERSATVIEVLEQLRLGGPLLRPARALFLGGGAALLPRWARDLMQRSRKRCVLDQSARLQLRILAPLIRSGLSDGVASRACARVGVNPDLLQRWPQAGAEGLPPGTGA